MPNKLELDLDGQAIRFELEDGITVRLSREADTIVLAAHRRAESAKEDAALLPLRTRNRWKKQDKPGAPLNRHRYSCIEVFQVVKTTAGGLCLRCGRTGNHAGDPVWVPWEVVRGTPRIPEGAFGVLAIEHEAAAARGLLQWETTDDEFWVGRFHEVYRVNTPTMKTATARVAALRSMDLLRTWEPALQQLTGEGVGCVSTPLTHLRVVWTGGALRILRRQGITTLEGLHQAYPTSTKFRALRGVGPITEHAVATAMAEHGLKWPPAQQDLFDQETPHPHPPL